MSACTCGHSIEEHGYDQAHLGSTACTECMCCAFEAEDETDEDDGDE